MRMTRAEPGSKWRKSRASDCREISASAPASSTPVGPPPIDHEREQRLPLRRIGLAFGVLECEEHAATDLQRVLERLQPGRERAPLVVPEVGVRRTGREDQVVVADLAVRQDAPGAAAASTLRTFREQHFDIAPGAGGSTGSARRCRRERVPRVAT